MSTNWPGGPGGHDGYDKNQGWSSPDAGSGRDPGGAGPPGGQPTPSFSQPPMYQPPPTQPPLKKLGAAALVLALLAGLAVVGGFTLFNQNDDNAETQAETEVAVAANYAFVEEEGPPPVFEPAGEEGNGAFVPLNIQLAAFAEENATADASEGAVRLVGGGATLPSDEQIAGGNWAGSVHETCDAERLIRHLMANPAKAEAWAAIQGISFNELPAYLRGLEAKILAAPAPVLNHGYDEAGQAAFQLDSVLEAGTAVLVDADGNIRVRCYCGNPILPKPILYEPPKCLNLVSLVFMTPGVDQFDGSAREVVLTGQIAETGSQHWSEVRWASGQTAWTPTYNLGESLCPPIIIEPGPCPGPGHVDVFATSAMQQVVGSVTGQVRTLSGPVPIAARISRAGGESGSVIENGAVLIHFARIDSLSLSSGWVPVTALQGASCGPITICAQLDARSFQVINGYSVSIEEPGRHFVTFTGSFSSGHAVMVLHRSGSADSLVFVGADEYQPLAQDACAMDDDHEFDGVCYRPDMPPVSVHSEPFAPNGELVASVVAAPVTLQELQFPVADSDVTLQRAVIGPNGPEGWIDQSKVGAHPEACARVVECAELFGNLSSVFPDQGETVEVDSEDEQLIGYLNLRGISDGTNFLHVRLEDGSAGWIEETAVHFTYTDPQECAALEPGVEICTEFVFGDPAGARGENVGATVYTDFGAKATVIGQVEEDLFQVVRTNPDFTGYLTSEFLLFHSRYCQGQSERLCILNTAPWFRSLPIAGEGLSPLSEEAFLAQSDMTNIHLAETDQLFMRVIREDSGAVAWIDMDVEWEPDYGEGECGEQPIDDPEIGDGQPCPEETICCLVGTFVDLTESTTGLSEDDLVRSTQPFPIRATNLVFVEDVEFLGEIWTDYIAIRDPGDGTGYIAAPPSSIWIEPCPTIDPVIEEVTPEPAPTVVPTPTAVPIQPAPEPLPTATVTPPPPPTATPQPLPTATPEPLPTATPTPPPPVHCAADVDRDGICDTIDPCIDFDGDGYCNDQDVCPDIFDDQTDSNGNGIGDACEFVLPCDDLNGDGVCDSPDPTPQPQPTPEPERFDTNRLIGMSRLDAENLLREYGISMALSKRIRPCSADDPNTLCEEVFELGPAAQGRIIIQIQLPFPNGGQIISARWG